MSGAFYPVQRCENESNWNETTLVMRQEYLKSENGAKIPIFHAELLGDTDKHFIVVASEKAKSALLMSFSVMTLYVSVVLVIGRLIRGVISGIWSVLFFRDLL